MEPALLCGAYAKESGIMQGELAADLIQEDASIDRNRDGQIQYVVLEGEPGHQDAIIRTENAVDTLKSMGGETGKAELWDCQLESGAGPEPDASDDRATPEPDRACSG